MAAATPMASSGEDISLASRIIGVVDAFDAMTTPRPLSRAGEPAGSA
jgi:HD-GYP domain-containing protein (c-di-GMP phosphodiesterase class II)